MALLIEQTFSQKAWPKAGDVDDCWVVSSIQCANAVAPWLPLLDVRQFRAFAGDPDDGVNDGGNVVEILKGAERAWPLLRPYLIGLKGDWTWARFLDEVKSGRPATVCVVSSKLPLPYGFSGLHQVTLFHEPGVGLRVANPLAPDRSEPTRIATATAKAAIEAYGNGKVYAVVFPSVEQAFHTHPLYQAPSTGAYSQAQVDELVDAAAAAARRPLEARLAVVHSLADRIKAA